MSRSGFSDGFDEEEQGIVNLYQQAIRRSITGARGQAFLRKLRDALDALPTKRLITDAIKDDSGDVCALGALDPNAPAYDDLEDDGEHPLALAKHFGIARALAATIVYHNDEWFSWRSTDETPEQRWTRMRRWVDEQIVREQ